MISYIVINNQIQSIAIGKPAWIELGKNAVDEGSRLFIQNHDFEHHMNVTTPDH